MGLVSMTGLLADAREHGYALGYFEAWDSYSLEAVVEAAEAENAPVILGFGCLLVDQAWLDGGGIEALGCLAARAAEQARVPVSLLLNEAHTLDHALRAIEAGFNAVMLCSDDTATVGELVRAAHGRGVTVEGELGTLPEGDSTGAIDQSQASLTDPEAAAVFVASTGVDCLAVSVGNVHTLEGAVASVDIDRLEQINRRIEVPLVLHGGSGFPADIIPDAISSGVAKFNVGTALKRAYLDGLRAAVGSAASGASPHELLGSHTPADLLAAARPEMVGVVRDLIRRYGGNGRAS